MGLPATYQPRQAEPRQVGEWQRNGCYAFDSSSPAPVFSIDTPPATVSGHLHLGHVYSYSQADFIARFWRMNGYNVFYPMGYDDNGLPTERLVERWKGITAARVGRKSFIEACLQVSVEAEKDYQQLWERLGLSVDWTHTYRTIDASSRRTAQLSFIDLYHKGLVYRKEAPSIWCPECQTAIAQADLDDLERPGEFITLDFKLEDGATLAIATTRPELLPACVAVFVHPRDERYTSLVGQRVRVPLFEQWVSIITDERADPQKGTGAVMCCTFGDQVDVEWWHIHNLPLVDALGKDGRMTAAAGGFAGLLAKEARSLIVAELDARQLVLSCQVVEQSVRVHERCDTAVEYRVTLQWFVKVLEHKAELLDLGRQVRWYPAHMQARYEEWVTNLHWDWCISRQRVYGVAFPAWTCEGCGALRIATEDELPVDPQESQPIGPCSCGSTAFIPDPDVMDTWATSSLSPQIVGRWLNDPQLYRKVFPFSMRPQAHEIIRTWAFYTLVKSFYHFKALPWKVVAISGWGLAPQGTGKISKSKGGGPMAPLALIERYSADAVRYWSASTGFGKDALISEEKVQAGAKMVTKLWNVARFSERFIGATQPDPRQPEDLHLSPADRWILARLQTLIRTTTQAFREYDYTTPKNEIEAYFWHNLADNYLEMAKQRLYGPPGSERDGAVFTLYRVLRDLLKLLAPILPFITEAVYAGLFAGREGDGSIHRTAWPQVDAAFIDPQAEAVGEMLVAIAGAVRRFKSERSLSLGLELDRLQLVCDRPDLAQSLQAACSDLGSVTRARIVELVDKPSSGLIQLPVDASLSLAVEISL